MDNSNFNASELNMVFEAINRMKNMSFSALAEAAGGGSSIANEDIGSLIKSEDSNLAASWQKSSYLGTQFYMKSSKIFKQISDEFEKYIKATIVNETDTSDIISNINAGLEANKDKLNQIEI